MKKLRLRDDKEFIPTRKSLLSRLRDWNDQASWKVFFDTYWRLIYTAALRAGLNDDEAQDVVQETVISVSKHIPEFVYDPTKGSFKTWLMRQTGWRIVEQFRKRLPLEVSGERSTHSPKGTWEGGHSDLGLMERLPDPTAPVLEKLWDEEWENNLFDAAVQRVKGKVDAKHYQLFDLYVNKQWSVTKIARDLKVTSARVYLAKHRIGNLIKKEISYLKTKGI